MAAPLADITSHDTYLEGVPHDTFAYLRVNDPVHWTEESDGGRGFWSLTKYDDVLFASSNAEIFSSRLGIRLEDMDPEETEARRTMMEMDSPEHTRLRRLVSRPFDDLEWLVQRGDALIGNTDPDFTDFVVDQVDTSDYRLLPFRSPVALELFEYASQALAERRIEPTHDVLSALLETTIDGDTLDELALQNFFTLMVAAGNDTTRYSLTNGLRVLIERPELYTRIPTMTIEERKALIEEMLRWSTVTMHFRRTLTQDTQLRGKTLKAGDKVVLWFSSANYDEEHFDSPYEFREDRSPNDHVAFGLRSPHLCLGAHLARLEMRVVFEEIVKRWEKVELIGTPERLRSNFIGGMKQLPIRVIWI
jgi:cytochrome P450